ncbi:MAG: hemin uptake protein HemP [Pseudomonadota bacterium]
MISDHCASSNPPVSEPPRYDARKLTDEGGVARIRLGEQVYTLRITRHGKLILTK